MKKMLFLAAMLFYAGSLQAAAGRFQFVSGEVNVIDKSGQSHAAKKGVEVSEGDTVVTMKNSSAQIKMADGGFLGVRPDTRLKVDSYVFSGKSDDKSTVSLLKGSFRAVTGLIGKNSPQNDLVKTPTATIGIRGTDHEVIYLPPEGEPVAKASSDSILR